ncbi:MAG: hypothetical protein LBF78_09935, partial [Treponema sp.]|nr:hypothetical protein [Treponema sp.]
MSKKRIYQIKRVTAIHKEWQESLSPAPVDIFPWGDPNAADDYRLATTAGVTADDTAFYVFMETAEDGIRAVERGFSANVYTDS